MLKKKREERVGEKRGEDKRGQDRRREEKMRYMQFIMEGINFIIDHLSNINYINMHT